MTQVVETGTRYTGRMLRRIVSMSVVLGAAALLPFACSSSSSPSGPSGPPGGAVAGPDDLHCAGGKKQQTNDSACHPGDAGDDGASTDTGAGDAGDAGDASTDAATVDTASDDAGAPACDPASHPPDYGCTLYNAAGDDDDCKYAITWTSDPIYENTDITFHLSAMRKFDGTWACGAYPYIEAYLDETHPAPNAGTHTSEVGTGKYDIGPIRFDKKGRWTVRFHLYGDCSDLTDDSPHGHAAFYVDVP